MKNDNKFLDSIYQVSTMGSFTLTKLLKDLKEKDNKIKKSIEKILKQYEDYAKTSKKYLKKNNIKPEEKKFLAKVCAAKGIKKEVKSDNSDTSVAKMLIQGITLGALEIEKKLDDYSEEITVKYKELGENFLNFQQTVINELKQYL